MAGLVVTVVACLLLVVVVVAPGEMAQLTPLAFLRVPLDLLVAVGAVLVLRPRARRWGAWLLGLLFGLLAIVKVVGVGFSTVLDRAFDPVLDWPFLQNGTEFLYHSIGKGPTIGVVIGAVVLALAVLVLVALSFRRVAGVAARHRTATLGVLTAGALAWLICLVTGVQIVKNVPVAAHDGYDRAVQAGESLYDREVFSAESAVDSFGATSAAQLLTGLRGKDMMLTFIESYGRVALEHPQLAPEITALLREGTDRLNAKGFSSRSGWLTSSTAGGGSWLAQSTLLSGLWIDHQQRYKQLMASDRLTLTAAFHRASWRTVAVMPGTTREWKEGAFFGYDRIYTVHDLGYRGPRYSFATMPDQYTLSAFERSERAAPGRGPLMAAVALISSHAPWDPVPPMVRWEELGDGSGFAEVPGAGIPPEIVLGRDAGRVRADYLNAITYSLRSLISYLETYGDDNLVMVFLGDHQPSTVITGGGASRDVPITIVARDPAMIERVAGWGWEEGIMPGPRAPVWRMDTFRDRFLTAFGSESAAK